MSMSGMVHGMKKALARWRRDESGFGTVEFIILFPVFMSLLLSGYEIGILMTRQTMMERGVDLAVRDLRLGLIDVGDDDALDESDVRKAICNYAGILPDCLNAIHLDLHIVSTSSFAMPAVNATCVDRTTPSIRPAVTFNSGDENDLMIVRACIVIDPFFPTSGLGAQLPVDASGGYQLVAMSAFVNEPNT